MLKRNKDARRRRVWRPAVFLLIVALAVVAVTVTLDAYDRLPVVGEPGLAAAVSVAAAAPPIVPTEPPHRMQVNHEILRLVDRDAVVDFYAAYTGDREVARVILEAALWAEVPVNLAFALGWQESRFDADAVSGVNYYGTRDWGLFQLNDAARPGWKRADFFDIRRNAESAMQYLRLCLGEMGSVDLALAAYNAGIRGVREWGIPASTRAYTIAIRGYERELDRAFGERF
jgi:soluble lytic murein transglycosylase-like protein